MKANTSYSFRPASITLRKDRRGVVPPWDGHLTNSMDATRYLATR